MASEPRRVLVVGGGAAGVVTAAALLREAGDAPLAVTVVERAPVVGPGLAYGTRDPHHLLNNYAGRMSAVDDDPQHLVRWCRAQGMAVGADTFVSRETYGRYLADLLDSEPVPAGSSLERVRDEVVDLADAGTSYLATLASGAVLSADVVVLALGNPPPRRPRGLAVEDARFVADPWDPDLLDRVGPEDRVLLVGTGLTTVDVCAQVAAARPGVRLTATSRRGAAAAAPPARDARGGARVRRGRPVAAGRAARDPAVHAPTAPTGAAWSSRSRRSPTTCGTRCPSRTRSSSPGTSGGTGRSPGTGWPRRWPRSSTTCSPPGG